MLRIVLSIVAVLLGLTSVADAKILDYYSTRLKALGAFHISEGIVKQATPTELTIQISGKRKGELPEKRITVDLQDRDFEQAYHPVELGQRVICFVFCEKLPENLRFEVRYGSPKRLLAIPRIDKDIEDVMAVLVEAKTVEVLRKLHGCPETDQEAGAAEPEATGATGRDGHETAAGAQRPDASPDAAPELSAILQFITIPSSDLPKGVRLVQPMRTGSLIPLTRNPDLLVAPEQIKAIARFFGVRDKSDLKTVRAAAAAIYQENDPPANEIGVYGLYFRDEKLAERWFEKLTKSAADPPFLLRGALLLYVWKDDDVSESAFKAVRDHLKVLERR